MPWGLLFILGYKKTVKGLGQSPDNPWAKCWTKIYLMGSPLKNSPGVSGQKISV